MSADLEAWRPVLVKWAAKRCPDPEDIVQEALLRCFLAERKGQAINRSFAYRVAHNLIIDGYRKHCWDDLTPFDERCQVVAPTPDPDAGVEAERLLRLMTPKQASVLKLTAAGFSGQEVANRLGLTLDAVKKLKARGINQARKAA